MKIALAQLNYTIGDIDGNISLVKNAVAKAKMEKADVVLFAECCIATVAVFALIYGIVYGVTAKTYYKIVE